MVIGSDILLSSVMEVLSAGKGESIVVLDVRGRSSVADYFVVAAGGSVRHVGSLADRLVEAMKAEYGLRVSVEGMEKCDWVLVDLGDIVVHLFRPEVRLIYDLEDLWGSDMGAVGDER